MPQVMTLEGTDGLEQVTVRRRRRMLTREQALAQKRRVKARLLQAVHQGKLTKVRAVYLWQRFLKRLRARTLAGLDTSFPTSDDSNRVLGMIALGSDQADDVLGELGTSFPTTDNANVVLGDEDLGRWRPPRRRRGKKPPVITVQAETIAPSPVVVEVQSDAPPPAEAAAGPIAEETEGGDEQTEGLGMSVKERIRRKFLRDRARFRRYRKKIAKVLAAIFLGPFMPMLPGPAQVAVIGGAVKGKWGKGKKPRFTRKTYLAVIRNIQNSKLPAARKRALILEFKRRHRPVVVGGALREGLGADPTMATGKPVQVTWPKKVAGAQAAPLKATRARVRRFFQATKAVVAQTGTAMPAQIDAAKKAAEAAAAVDNLNAQVLRAAIARTDREIGRTRNALRQARGRRKLALYRALKLQENKGRILFLRHTGAKVKAIKDATATILLDKAKSAPPEQRVELVAAANLVRQVPIRVSLPTPGKEAAITGVVPVAPRPAVPVVAAWSTTGRPLVTDESLYTDTYVASGYAMGGLGDLGDEQIILYGEDDALLGQFGGLGDLADMQGFEGIGDWIKGALKSAGAAAGTSVLGTVQQSLDKAVTKAQESYAKQTAPSSYFKSLIVGATAAAATSALGTTQAALQKSAGQVSTPAVARMAPPASTSRVRPSGAGASLPTPPLTWPGSTALPPGKAPGGPQPPSDPEAAKRAYEERVAAAAAEAQPTSSDDAVQEAGMIGGLKRYALPILGVTTAVGIVVAATRAKPGPGGPGGPVRKPEEE
jgi:hypothetical protein